MTASINWVDILETLHQKKSFKVLSFEAIKMQQNKVLLLQGFTLQMVIIMETAILNTILDFGKSFRRIV